MRHYRACTITIYLLSLGLLAVPVTSDEEAGSFGDGTFARLMMDSDMIALATAKTLPSRVGNYRGQILTIKRVIASIWTEQETCAHMAMSRDGESMIFMVDHVKRARSDGIVSNPALSFGAYSLVWLKRFEIPADKAEALGIKASACFIVPYGKRGSYLMSDVRKITNYERIIKDMYPYLPHAYEEEYLKHCFEGIDRAGLLAATEVFASAMMQGPTADGLLEELSQKEEPIYRLTARELLKKVAARRFRFISQEAPRCEGPPDMPLVDAWRHLHVDWSPNTGMQETEKVDPEQSESIR